MNIMIVSTYRRLIKFFTLLKALPVSLFFNLKYLPFKQAVKILIILVSVQIVNLKGGVRIEHSKIRFGMIRMGYDNYTFYENVHDGIVWDNAEGMCIFKGDAHIKVGSAIQIGKNAILEFGSNFTAGPMLKIAYFHYIKIDSDCSFSWECQLIDTNFLPITSLTSGEMQSICGDIVIGRKNWLGLSTVVLKNTRTSNDTIVG